MTAPPVNSDEDYYMDESFDEESLSEVEEEPEEDVHEDSDSRSESDVEAEFLRGNVSGQEIMAQPQELTIKHFSLSMPHVLTPHTLPIPQPHARRQQVFGKRSGGGSGFPREQMMAYNSSSEDEDQVVIRKTVVEVNQSKQFSVQTDDETLSDRTLVPNGNPEDSDLTELEDDDDNNDDNDVDDDDDIEMDEEDIAYEVEYVNNALESGQSKSVNAASVAKKLKPSQQQSDLVDIVDCGTDTGSCTGESDVEKCSSQNSDSEMEFTAMPIVQNKKPQKRSSTSFPHLERVPVLPVLPVDTDVPTLPKLKDIPSEHDDGTGAIDVTDGMDILPPDTFNVKFLEQQMTQMSEMIMKTFRLSGGAADNNAFEQLAMATKLMKSQGSKLTELGDDPESISTIESTKTPTTVRSEILGNRSSCRCPSITDGQEPEDAGSFLMDECGQGDGLLRYSQSQQSQSSRINCRVSSVTPTSFNSDNCGYHIDIRRPRSTTSSTEKVNYKNVGRKSFSFTNPQVREIERQNNILLKKMMHVKPTIKPAVNAVKSSSNLQAKNQHPPGPRLTSAAVNRKKYQRQIDLDNDVLKRKLEAVGSRRPIFK